MKSPICARPLMDDERTRLEAGLRSSSAFVLRRCQILLARARGERPPQVARALGYNDRTVRTVIRHSNRRLGCVCKSVGHRQSKIAAMTHIAR